MRVLCEKDFTAHRVHQHRGFRLYLHSRLLLRWFHSGVYNGNAPLLRLKLINSHKSAKQQRSDQTAADNLFFHTKNPLHLRIAITSIFAGRGFSTKNPANHTLFLFNRKSIIL